MATETRTVHFTVAPELTAYLKWVNWQPGQAIAFDSYDLFAAGYRAALEDQVTEAMLERAVRTPLERPR